jgi:hypothetical protein
VIDPAHPVPAGGGANRDAGSNVRTTGTQYRAPTAASPGKRGRAAESDVTQMTFVALRARSVTARAHA